MLSSSNGNSDTKTALDDEKQTNKANYPAYFNAALIEQTFAKTTTIDNLAKINASDKAFIIDLQISILFLFRFVNNFINSISHALAFEDSNPSFRLILDEANKYVDVTAEFRISSHCKEGYIYFTSAEKHFFQQDMITGILEISVLETELNKIKSQENEESVRTGLIKMFMDLVKFRNLTQKTAGAIEYWLNTFEDDSKKIPPTDSIAIQHLDYFNQFLSRNKCEIIGIRNGIFDAKSHQIATLLEDPEYDAIEETRDLFCDLIEAIIYVRETISQSFSGIYDIDPVTEIAFSATEIESEIVNEYIDQDQLQSVINDLNDINSEDLKANTVIYLGIQFRDILRVLDYQTDLLSNRVVPKARRIINEAQICKVNFDVNMCYTSIFGATQVNTAKTNKTKSAPTETKVTAAMIYVSKFQDVNTAITNINKNKNELLIPNINAVRAITKGKKTSGFGEINKKIDQVNIAIRDKINTPLQKAERHLAACVSPNVAALDTILTSLNTIYADINAIITTVKKIETSAIEEANKQKARDDKALSKKSIPSSSSPSSASSPSPPPIAISSDQLNHLIEITDYIAYIRQAIYLPKSDSTHYAILYNLLSSLRLMTCYNELYKNELVTTTTNEIKYLREIIGIRHKNRLEVFSEEIAEHVQLQLISPDSISKTKTFNKVEKTCQSLYLLLKSFFEEKSDKITSIKNTETEINLFITKIKSILNLLKLHAVPAAKDQYIEDNLFKIHAIYIQAAICSELSIGFQTTNKELQDFLDYCNNKVRKSIIDNKIMKVREPIAFLLSMKELVSAIKKTKSINKPKADDFSVSAGQLVNFSFIVQSQTTNSGTQSVEANVNQVPLSPMQST